MFIQCPRAVGWQTHICSQQPRGLNTGIVCRLPGPDPLTDLMATIASLGDIFKCLRALTGFQYYQRDQIKTQVPTALKWLSNALQMYYSRDPKRSVTMVEGQATHHGLILISGIGKQVKKTVPRRKGFLPHTSDKAPMRGALRKDSRPWRGKQKQRSDVQCDPPITCNSYFLNAPIPLTGPQTE